MASMLMSSLLAVFFLAHTTISLQVSSNSPCTSVCTSSSSSSTLGSEIACLDADYAGTSTGQKFMSCVSCLQTSTASDENGSDQEWFLCKFSLRLTRKILTFLVQIIFVLLWMPVCLDFNGHPMLSPPNAPRVIHVSVCSSLSGMATLFPPTRPSILTAQRTATRSRAVLSICAKIV